MISSRQRKEIILQKVNEEGYVQVAVLADTLNVSQATIRTDLSVLEGEGLLYRVHGSAMAKDPVARDRTTPIKKGINAEAKRKIATAALKYLEGCDTALLSSGSTVQALADIINPIKHMDIFTPCILVASSLCSKPNVTIHLLGGVVHHNSLGTRAEYSQEILSRIHCAVMFYGADGIDVKNGVTCSTVEEAVYMQKILESSLKNVLLCDSSKVGKIGVGRICDISGIDVLITDKGFPKKELAAIENAGVEVILV